MITDKVRIEIITKLRNFNLLTKEDEQNGIVIRIISPEEIVATKEISKDSDNWIDITLPEEIDGCKRFEVNIKYGFRDGYNQTWSARMYPIVKTERAKTFYELQVTVY